MKKYIIINDMDIFSMVYIFMEINRILLEQKINLKGYILLKNYEKINHNEKFRKIIC